MKLVKFKMVNRMKSKLLILVSLILLTACSTQEIITEDLVITEQERFKLFKDETISISTNEPVRLTYKYPKGNTVTKKKTLHDFTLSDYKIAEDSLVIDNSDLNSIIALKHISSIRFKGVWDDQLGYVPESRLAKLIPPGMNRATGLVTGSLIGGVVGSLSGLVFGLVTGTDPKLFGGSSTKEENITAGVLIGTLIGTTMGAVLGITVFSSDPPDINQILKKMKEQKNEKY